MSSLSQYDGWTAEDIQLRHGCDALTAMHVIQARAHILEQRREHVEQMRQLQASLDEAHRIGLAVMRAKRAGRKMIRVDEVAP